METSVENNVSSPGGMITEAQGGATENGVKTQVNASQILQNALLPLQEKFPEHQLPTNRTMWMNLYTKYIDSSHIVSYEEHLYTWLSLILSAIQLENDVESLLDCYIKAISLLPIKMFETDNKWTALINSLYALIIDDTLSETAASPALKTAEDKFKFSPKHAREYWLHVIRNEKLIAKKYCNTPHELHLRITELLKKRYSTPYLTIDEDYAEFCNWSSNVYMDQNLKLELQKIYLENASVDKMVFAKRLLKQKNHLDRHILFEQWVHELTEDWGADPVPNFKQIEVICEEMIASEPACLCFYWIYLNALALIKFEGDPRRDQKILSIIQRAHLLEYPTSSCEGIEQRFLEFSLVIGSQTLPVEKVLGLIEVVLKQFPITGDVTRWYASSRGVIIAVNNLRIAQKIDDSAFESYFKKIIHPCTFHLYMYNEVPESFAEKTGYEIPCIDLLTLWLKMQESHFNMSWDQTLNLWTNYFSFNSNPIFLVGYVDFVKTRGNVNEAMIASEFALNQMKKLEAFELKKESSQRCHIHLLQNHLEILVLTGSANQQIQTAKELQNKMNLYIRQFPNSNICDVTRPGYKIKGFSPYQTDGFSMSCDPSHSESKDPVNSSGQETMKLYKVFISRLHQNASDEDLINAFKGKGFYPVAVEIKRFFDGRSRGVATVSFKSQNDADLAIRRCFKLNVCGRQALVKEFKENHKYQVRKPTPSEPQPTTLNLKNLSEEWQDEVKVKDKLAPFGHVKNVLRKEDFDGSFISMTVEFHMKEDAENAFEQVRDNKIFGDNVLCRLGYVSLKQKLEEDKAKYRMEIEKNNPKNPKVLLQKEMEIDQEQVEQDQEVSSLLDLENSSSRGTDASTTENNEIGPQVPMGFIMIDRKPDKKNYLRFMPMQALRRDLPRATKRNHMKNRLDFGGPSNSSGSLQESQDPNSRDESALDNTFSSTCSTDSTESPSPRKKFPRMNMDRDVEGRLHSNSVSSPKDNDMVVQELEIPTDSQAGSSSKLTNEDFKKMFQKN